MPLFENPIDRLRRAAASNEFGFLATPRDGPLALPGDILGLLGHTVFDPLKGGGMSLAGNILGPIEEKNPLRPAETRAALAAQMASGQNGEELIRTILRSSSLPGAETLGEIAFDPTSFVGVGAAKGLKTGGEKLLPKVLDPAAAKRAIDALELLQKADEGTVRLSSKAMEGILKSPKAIAQQLGRVPGLEKVGQLAELSPESVAANIETNMMDAAQHARQGGLGLQEDAADYFMLKNPNSGGDFIPPYPGTMTTPTTPGVVPGIQAEIQTLTNAPAAWSNLQVTAAAPQAGWLQYLDDAQQRLDPLVPNAASLFKDAVDYAKRGDMTMSLGEVDRVRQGLMGLTSTPIPGAKGGSQILNELNKEARAAISRIEDPEKRAEAIRMLGQQNLLMADAMDHFWYVRKGVENKYGVNALSGKTAKTPDEFKGWTEIGDAAHASYDKSARATQALRYLAEKLADDFPLPPGVTPDPAQLASVQQGLTEIEQAVTSFGAKIASAKTEAQHAGLVLKRNKRIQDVVEGLTGFGPLPPDATGRLAQRLDEMGNLANGDLGLTALIPERLRGDQDLMREVLNEVKALGKSKRLQQQVFPEGTDYWDVAVKNVGQRVRKELGLAEPRFLERQLGSAGKGIERGYGTGMGLWKEMRLARPAYAINNLVSGLAMMAAEGVSPAGVLRELPRNIGKAWRNEPILTRDMENLVDVTGIVPSVKLFSENGIQAELMAARDFGLQETGKRASERLGSKALGIAGGGIGGVSGGITADEDENAAARTGAGAVVGGVVGAAFPKISKIMFKLTGAVESAMREETFLHAAVPKIQEGLPGLMDRVQQVIATPRTQMRPKAGVSQGRQAYNTTLSAPAQQRVMDEIQSVLAAQQNLISGDTVQGILIKHGVPIEDARGVKTFWVDHLDLASQEGLALSNKVHFDYQNLTNFEQFARDVLPFSTWAMKAYPFYARHLAARPGFAVALKELNEASEEQKKAMGLTGRFSGSLHVGAGDMVLSALMGHDVSGFFNPMRAITPFGDIGRGFAQADRDESSPLGGAVGKLEAILPGLSPLLEAPLRYTGMLGKTAPTDSYVGGAGPIKALTGIDLAAPEAMFERNVREKLGGQEPVDYTRLAIDKRIDELAVQAGVTTGAKGAASLPYQQAKIEQKGPVYERAKAEVEREQSARALVGATAGPLAPQAVLPAEERRIREARRPASLETGGYAQLEARAAKELDEAMKRPQTAKAAASPAVMDATQDQIRLVFGGQVPEVLQRQLDVGTYERVDGIRKALYQVQLANEPLLGAYGAAGGGREAEIKNQMALAYNPMALLASEPGVARLTPAARDRLGALLQEYEKAPPAKQAQMRKGNRGLAQLLPILKQRQENFKTLHPEVKGYLEYEKATQGAGTLPAYLKRG